MARCRRIVGWGMRRSSRRCSLTHEIARRCRHGEKPDTAPACAGWAQRTYTWVGPCEVQDGVVAGCARSDKATVERVHTHIVADARYRCPCPRKPASESEPAAEPGLRTPVARAQRTSRRSGQRRMTRGGWPSPAPGRVALAARVSPDRRRLSAERRDRTLWPHAAARAQRSVRSTEGS